MEQRFSTQEAHPADRFAYWREAVCSSYVPLDCATAEPHRFHGRIDLTRREVLSSSQVSGSNQTVSRRLHSASMGEDETFLVSLQLKRTGFLEQDGRLARLEPGDFALYSSSSRYRLTLPDDFAQLVLQFPRADFLARLPSAEGLTAVTAPRTGGFGAIARELLPRLVEALETTPSQAQHSAQQTIIDLLVAAFASMMPERVTLHSHDQLVLLRARSYIARNLSDPALDREAVARDAGLSVRRLNEIFQADHSSLSRDIAQARINRVAADLANPLYAKRSVSEIAFANGVTNFQSFSRLFRAKMGQTPSEYRASLSSAP
ncbi:helix-turn-helix domain-containing protein [Cereibacter sphaeroides]|nr:helix-turn-helix domain-containing protein [Cereibacter sphaeroides]